MCFGRLSHKFNHFDLNQSISLFVFILILILFFVCCWSQNKSQYGKNCVACWWFLYRFHCERTKTKSIPLCESSSPLIRRITCVTYDHTHTKKKTHTLWWDFFRFYSGFDDKEFIDLRASSLACVLKAFMPFMIINQNLI